jgi:hypothetical protein
VRTLASERNGALHATSKHRAKAHGYRDIGWPPVWVRASEVRSEGRSQGGNKQGGRVRAI